MLEKDRVHICTLHNSTFHTIIGHDHYTIISYIISVTYIL